jgi:hypothetical protein
MLGLLVVGLLETAWQANSLWGFTRIIPAVPNPPADAEPIRARPVPIENYPAQLKQRDDIEQMGAGEEGIKMLGLDRTETIYLLGPAFDSLEDALVSGRMPEPGAAEVLAGDLAREDPFWMGGREFTVVGRLARGMGGLTFAYALQGHANFEPMFQEGAGAVRGYLVNDPAALDSLAHEYQDSPEALATLPGAEWFSPLQRTHPVFAVSAIAMLALVALGSMLAHGHALRWLAERTPLRHSALIRAMGEYPRVWFGVHAAGYGLLLGSMTLSLFEPVTHLHLMSFVQFIFSEGGLGYLGDAYASGNVIAAANATWWNNYVLQTLGLTLALSVPPLALGFLKTLASFGLVGLIMSPQWTGVAASYSIHAGTMALELEPYMIACFAVVLWALSFWHGVAQPATLLRRTIEGLRLLAEAAVLCGILLYAAALYEAVTLIALMGH